MLEKSALQFVHVAAFRSPSDRVDKAPLFTSGNTTTHTATYLTDAYLYTHTTADQMPIWDSLHPLFMRTRRVWNMYLWSHWSVQAGYASRRTRRRLRNTSSSLPDNNEGVYWDVWMTEMVSDWRTDVWANSEIGEIVLNVVVCVIKVFPSQRVHPSMHEARRPRNCPDGQLFFTE